MEISRVVVIGFGTMGTGIAQIFAQTGFEVVAVDLSEDILRKGIEIILVVLLV
jgi:3-hydroxybutyryl-CoA dehydrogenase